MTMLTCGVLLASPLPLVPVSYAQTGVAVPELAHVDHVVQSFLDECDVPGAALALTYQGRLVYARGFGLADLEDGSPVEPTDLFRVASVSKPITATTIMRLRELGLVDLHDTVLGPGGILNTPQYSAILDPRATEITVCHLLQHRGGWDGWRTGDPLFDPLMRGTASAGEGTNSPSAIETIIHDVLAYQMLDFAPGTRYAYSNFGYALLGRVIETVTGLSYETAVRRYLLEPVGIETMQLGGNYRTDRAPHEVANYDYPGAPLMPSFAHDQQLVPAPYGYFDMALLDAAGGWIASPVDLVRLLTAIDGLPARPDVLSRESIAAMTSPDPDYQYYGLGWSVDPPAYICGHTGAMAGTTAFLYQISAPVCLAFLCNSQTPTDEYWDALGRLLDDVLDGVAVWPEHDLFATTTTVAAAAPTVPANPTVMGAPTLAQNYPNPFNPATTISFELPRTSHARLSVFTLDGRRVTDLANGYLPAGEHSFVWDGTDAYGRRVPSSTYYYRLDAGNLSTARKMILLK